MTKVLRPVELPEPMMHEAERLAAGRGHSLEEWLTATVESRIATEALFLEKGREASVARALDILRKIPDVPPPDGDELPPGWSPI